MEKILQQYSQYLLAGNFSEMTRIAYLGDLEQFFIFAASRHGLKMADLPIAQIDGLTVRAFVHDLMLGGVGKRSVARKLSSVRSFYKYAMSENLVSENPVQLIKAPKNTPNLPRFLFREHVDKLFMSPAATTQPPTASHQPPDLSPKDEFVFWREQVILELLYGSGLRVSELVALNFGQIDLTNKLLRILGKGRKERIIPLTDLAARAVRTYREKRELMRMPLAEPAAALLLNLRGGRLTTQSVRRILNDCERKAQLNQHIHPHMLRHTYATHLLDGGADLRSVQELLGHKNLSSTQIYTHLTKDRLRQTYMKAHPRAKLPD
ncbi:MAG: tyrosine-type recombinase/integrase [Peptococcaceae bacterium]|nr:tyrosine-type recombinase/integrase [Peptococcaceae bacterium]